MSGIQRIGYHFLYNGGIKSEANNPLKNNNGGDLRQYAPAKGGTKGNTMKKVIGCSIDFASKTITLTKAYAKKVNTPGTKEFRELAALHKNYPDFDIVMRTATVNEDKEKHNGLTFDRMEFIIKNYAKSEDALAEFKEVKKFYKGVNGYYGKVKAWFLDKYPNYQSMDFSANEDSQEPVEQASDTEAKVA